MKMITHLAVEIRVYFFGWVLIIVCSKKKCFRRSRQQIIDLNNLYLDCEILNIENF